MTEKLFAALDVYHDHDSSRSAALNMAIDEALLEIANRPTIRFYQWDHPAVSFGYFGKFSEVEQCGCDIVRRWTGGGIVSHGEDLTYSIVIPANDSAFGASATEIYEKVHRALRDTLIELGQHAVVAVVADRGTPVRLGPGVSDAGYTGECFANPVRADVMLNGRKIAGAAQRRTKRGLLQQGSIQAIELPKDFQRRFANELSKQTAACCLSAAVLHRAQVIAAAKYATAGWLRKR
jgi:lipoate-protein ligase A